jgi:hypothetical protein
MAAREYFDTPVSSEDDMPDLVEDDGEEDDEDPFIIRAKWQMDGARTLDEAINKLKGFIEYLRELKDDGWELRDSVEDDYGFLYKRD